MGSDYKCRLRTLLVKKNVMKDRNFDISFEHTTSFPKMLCLRIPCTMSTLITNMLIREFVSYGTIKGLTCNLWESDRYGTGIPSGYYWYVGVASQPVLCDYDTRKYLYCYAK